MLLIKLFIILFSVSVNASLNFNEVIDIEEEARVDHSAGSEDAPLRYANIFTNNDRFLLDQRDDLTRRIKNKIGKLYMPEGNYCTASLVWKNLILTAAHCVADSSKTKIQKGTYRFCLNYNQGECTDESDVSWLWWGNLNPEENGRRNDWAILKLKKPLGRDYGYFGWRTPDLNEKVNHAGFGKLFFNGQKLSIHQSCNLYSRVYEDGLVNHDCDTSKGDSGAPIFICSESDCRIVALAVSEKRDGGSQTLTLDHYSSEYANIAVLPAEFRDKLKELRAENP